MREIFNTLPPHHIILRRNIMGRYKKALTFLAAFGMAALATPVNAFFPFGFSNFAFDVMTSVMFTSMFTSSFFGLGFPFFGTGFGLFSPFCW
jgi:hypothetical protein